MKIELNEEATWAIIAIVVGICIVTARGESHPCYCHPKAESPTEATGGKL